MATAATMSGAQFDALPYAEGRRWELIAGDLVEVSSPTPEHQILVQKILLSLALYVRAGVRALVLADVEFALADNIRVRPDVFILLGDKAERLDRFKVPIDGQPDIAIEVISHSERTSDSARKVQLYLDHGVLEVWQVFPKLRQIIVHTAVQNIRKLSADAALTTDLLPGFELPLATLFAD